jgi:hypothetical protein
MWSLMMLFCDTVSKYHIQKTAIFHFLPQLKLHHIVLVNQDKDVLAIDFTPINQTYPATHIKLALGKNVPAEIRVRKIKEWNMEEWTKAQSIDINAVSVLANMDKKEWTKMNLYRHNCQHFSKEFITHFRIKCENATLPL